MAKKVNSTDFIVRILPNETRRLYRSESVDTSFGIAPNIYKIDTLNDSLLVARDSYFLARDCRLLNVSTAFKLFIHFNIFNITLQSIGILAKYSDKKSIQ